MREHSAGRPRLLAALALTGTLVLPAAATGHAIVLESFPAHDAALLAPPGRVVLRFNGRIEHALSRATIEEVGGRPMAVPVSSVAPDLPSSPDRLVIPLRPLRAGTYVVRFKVLAADGHIILPVDRSHPSLLPGGLT